MANVRPFTAWRPVNGYAEKIASLPYDVYSRSEACEEVKNKPLSFLRIDRAETAFDSTVGTYDDRVYKKAGELFRDLKERGYLIKEEKPLYYVYSLTMGDRTQTGLVLCASVDDYINGTILKHENTRADKEADRFRHIDELSAQTGLVFLAYRAVKEIGELISRVRNNIPLYDFTSDDGIRHAVWAVDNGDDIAAVTEILSHTDHFYIADGHHRAASAVAVALKRRAEHPDYSGDEEYNYFLSVLFPDDELMIMDYNRVVKDLNGHTVESFLNSLSEKFDVEYCGKEPYRPRKKGEIGMFLDGGWYRLESKICDQKNDPVSTLDVSLLQNEVLAPILGISDPKTDGRIEFVGGIRGLGEPERRARETHGVAFAMYPTTIAELFAVADAGLLMPPKSTWFEPKLRSGLLIHEIEK